MTPSIHDMAVRLLEAAENRQRFLVALAGPPGAGKSFLTERLCRELDTLDPGIAAVVPMDGYHFDNAILEPLGQLPIKGAPETFDPDGLRHDLERIRRADRPVAVPVFDRPLDLARAGGRLITLDHRIVIVEGNYLLLDRDPWRELHPLFDMTVLLEVADEVLEARLIQRWLDMGQDHHAAHDKACHKDMANARLIKAESIDPDFRWS